MSPSASGQTPQYETDYDLLLGCRRGERRAWSGVLDRYERLVYSIPLNYGLPVADAADIAQATFTIFLESLEDLDDDSNLSAWLATVARRQTWRMLEHSNRERVSSEADLGEQLFFMPDEDSQRPFQRTEMLQWLNQGLNALDDRCRRLLLALYFSPQQPSYEDVAQAMDMAVGSVGPTRARCLQRLKQFLEEMG
ncbi:MAG TPA: sigma-70 family RNA polymerase sigma factor [Candidatus Sulfomarinibacteraceae bacterium]|nr:sigma-70 family RNA polymerase sigma factor [Candidatus Sulfomarinibacteraceae bacterium]